MSATETVNVIILEINTSKQRKSSIKQALQQTLTTIKIDNNKRLRIHK